MRALRISEGHRLEVAEVDDPEPGPGQVVVRVAACGICGSDLHMVESKAVPVGAIMGHEPSGIVEGVGDGVSLVAGDHVAIHPADPCGDCPACVAGHTMRCPQTGPTSIGLGILPGAYADRVLVGQGMCTKLPDDLDLEHGALTEPLAVALHGLRRSGFEPGMTVGVVGCGPIGLCSVLVAKASGAEHVWASDPNAFRADLAARAGADETGPTALMADIVVECAGAQGTIDLAVGSTNPGGQVVLLAVNIKGDSVFPFMWVIKEVDILPCLGYSRAEYDEAARWIADGTVDVSPLITKRVPLEETDEIFFALLDGAPEGKVLVKP